MLKHLPWLLALPLGLWLMAAGAPLLNALEHTNGPMGLDVSPLGGLAGLLLGILLVDQAVEHLPGPARWVYPPIALMILAEVGPNFFFYPPIDDGAYFGAYFMVRYGRDRFASQVPADAFLHMFVFLAAAWTVYGGLAPLSGREGRRFGRLNFWGRAGLFVALSAVCCVACDWFVPSAHLEHLPSFDGPGLEAAIFLAGIAAVFAGSLTLARRYQAALMTSLFAGTTALLCVTTLWLYWWPLG